MRKLDLLTVWVPGMELRLSHLVASACADESIMSSAGVAGGIGTVLGLASMSHTLITVPSQHSALRGLSPGLRHGTATAISSLSLPRMLSTHLALVLIKMEDVLTALTLSGKFPLRLGGVLNGNPTFLELGGRDKLEVWIAIVVAGWSPGVFWGQ